MDKKIIPQVTCDVVNCKHNCNGALCDASEIHVGGDSCAKSRDTNCATFEIK